MSRPTVNTKSSLQRRDSGTSPSPSHATSTTNHSPSHASSSPSTSSGGAKSITQGISQLSVNNSGQRRLSTSSSTQNHAKVTMVRRRLSVMGGAGDNKTKLDGAALEELKDEAAKHQVHRSGLVQRSPALGPTSPVGAPIKKKRVFSCYASLSKVGYVPFNPNKVNQDRTAEVSKFNSDDQKAFFGVFDGHGSLGHEVSQFASQELPKFFLKQSNLDTDPSDAITKAFLECNTKLSKSSTDCTFSGTTVIVTYLTHDKIYSCNAGDSRAVLGRLIGTTPQGNNKYKEIPLSSDHKPERADEKKRILECKGRVEACKGAKGEDIGPARVWLAHQDVPGLAMTRSFGDLIAASVGVSPKPEIWEHTVSEEDKFIIIASDGVWEFISNQEAVDIVGAHGNPEEACKILVEEATKRWHQEEEVVDDITAVVIFL